MRSRDLFQFNIYTRGFLRKGRGPKKLRGLQALPYVQAHLLGRSVDVDEDKQQEVEEDADDPQHGQEPLLWCA